MSPFIISGFLMNLISYVLQKSKQAGFCFESDKAFGELD